MSAPGSAGGRIARAVAWWFALLVGLLVLATVNRLTYGGGPAVERVGTASVLDCVQHGPVGLEGFGITYSCTAEVHWADGEVEVREFPAGQLGPADAGTSVPVYLDIADGPSDTTHIGRNDSARFTAVGFPATLLLGFGVLVLGIGALSSTYQVVRPDTGARERASRRRGHAAAEWPVTGAETKAVPAPRLVTRLRWLSAWCVLVVVAVPLSTVPRFDAERARVFSSPWPQIGQALLTDVPAEGAVIIGLVLAGFFVALSVLARRDAARVVKYGPAYLARDLPGSGSTRKRLDERLRQVAAAHRRGRVTSMVFGLLLLVLAVWAAVRGIGAAPAGAPIAVWLACVRDAVLLLSLAVLWLSTIETRHERLRRLLGRHDARDSEIRGTGDELRSS